MTRSIHWVRTYSVHLSHAQSKQHRFPSPDKMAFTAYIFDEDYRRLTKDFNHSNEGGSLYGQWTSTGNPVIHVAFSCSLPKQPGMTEYLSESYKLCHIGEWRPVRAGSGNVPRENLLSKHRGRGTPEKFVVVDVTQDKIKPNLYEKRYEQHALKGQGNLERLSGENPFNRVLGNPQAARHDPPPYRQPAMAGQDQRNPGYARSQSQEVEIKGHQWYSSDRGNEKLQKVFLKFQDIAASGTKVDMARDTNTHDMSMVFTDKLNNKWEVKFPYNFPDGGATLINKSQSLPSHGGARRATSYQASYGAGVGAAEQRVPGSAHLDTAVTNIISQTRSTRIY